MPECSLVDPDPVRIGPGTELPFDIAVAIRRDEVTFEQVPTEQPHPRGLLR